MKLIRLLQILKEKTDENNVLNAQELCFEMSKYGIESTRKTVYSDIEALNSNGFDIILTRQGKHGYFLASRDFELAEVRLMLDAVQSADFISEKKTNALVKKIGSFVSQSQYKKLKNQVFVDGRIKCENEEVYYSIDMLNKAIEEKKQVSFHYLRHEVSQGKKIVYCEKIFTANPYALIWSNDHYYLVCNNPKYDDLMNVRIDRMKKVKILDEKVRSFEEVSEYKEKFDVADYANKMFNMYSGEIEEVELVCSNSLLEEFIDRFGESCIGAEDLNRFRVKTKVAISDGFISWLMQYGDNVFIRKPEELKDKLVERSKNIIKLYQ